ncbi:DUF1024 family protein [Staphylococcus aureus]
MYKKAQAFDEYLRVYLMLWRCTQEDIGLDEAVGIMTGQVVVEI